MLMIRQHRQKLLESSPGDTPQRIRSGALHSEKERDGNTTSTLRRPGSSGVGDHARLPVVRVLPLP